MRRRLGMVLAGLRLCELQSRRPCLATSLGAGQTRVPGSTCSPYSPNQASGPYPRRGRTGKRRNAKHGGVRARREYTEDWSAPRRRRQRRDPVRRQARRRFLGHRQQQSALSCVAVLACSGSPASRLIAHATTWPGAVRRTSPGGRCLEAERVYAGSLAGRPNHLHAAWSNPARSSDASPAQATMPSGLTRSPLTPSRCPAGLAT